MGGAGLEPCWARGRVSTGVEGRADPAYLSLVSGQELHHVDGLNNVAGALAVIKLY